MEQHDLNIFENTGFDEVSKAHLLETTRWTKFLAVLGFIFTGLLAIFALAFIFMGASLFASYPSEMSASGLGATMGFVFLISAALYFYPIYSLLKFSTCMKRGLNTGSRELINEGFRYQKNMYRFIGIMAIIVIALYLLLFVLAGIGVATRSI